MEKHTPIPWYIDDCQGHPYIAARIPGNEKKPWNNPTICNFYDDVTPEDSVTIGAQLKSHENAETNAAFILRAVNNHDTLIAALEALTEAYQDLHNAVFPLASEDPSLSHIGSEGQEAHDQARAALKAAKEGA